LAPETLGCGEYVSPVTIVVGRDQRITQDVDKTCNKFSEILARLLISPFTIAYYVYQTWSRYVSVDAVRDVGVMWLCVCGWWVGGCGVCNV